MGKENGEGMHADLGAIGSAQINAILTQLNRWGIVWQLMLEKDLMRQNWTQETKVCTVKEMSKQDRKAMSNLGCL